MIEILMHASDGNTCDNGFKTSICQRVADALADDLKTRHTCVSQFIRLKKDYKEVKHLHNLSGFGWDNDRNVLMADEEMWAPVLQGRAELKKWKRDPFPWFEQIEAMYGDRLAISTHSFRPGQQSPLRELSDNDDSFINIDTVVGTVAQDHSANHTPQLQEIAEPEGFATAKRHNTPAESQHQKRHRTTGIAVMKDMSNGVKWCQIAGGHNAQEYCDHLATC